MASEMSTVVSGAKKHPTVALALVGFVIAVLFILRRSGGSSAQSAGAAYNPQYAQLEAALASQQSQNGAQVQAAQIAANAQQSQINAGLNVQNTQTEAELIAALAQNQTQAQANGLSAEVVNNQYQTEGAIASSQIAAELAALENTNATQLSAYTTGVQAQTATQQAELATLPSVIGQFQHLGIGENYNNEILAALGEVTGAPGVAVAGINASSSVLNTSAAASASKFSSFFNGLNNSLSSVLATL